MIKLRKKLIFGAAALSLCLFSAQSYAENISLKDLFYDGASSLDEYKICKDFQDNYVNFAYLIDKNLEQNFYSYIEEGAQFVQKQKSCRKLKDSDIEKLTEEQVARYNDSPAARAIRLRAGYVFTEEGEDRELAIRCNLLSDHLKKRTEALKTINSSKECAGAE